MIGERVPDGSGCSSRKDDRTAPPALRLAHYHGNVTTVSIAHSKLTSQGQISVPAEVRRRLGLAPGSVIEWTEEDGRIVVRAAGKNSSEDIHKALFARGAPKPVRVEDMKRAVAKAIRARHARGRY
jgi:AbrB family looped-hinge helix DNA binding protein